MSLFGVSSLMGFARGILFTLVHSDAEEDSLSEPPKAASSAAKSSLFVEQSVDSFEESADYSSSGLTRSLKAKDKKKKRKKKDRVRHVVISDQAQNEDLPAVSKLLEIIETCGTSY